MLLTGLFADDTTKNKDCIDNRFAEFFSKKCVKLFSYLNTLPDLQMKTTHIKLILYIWLILTITASIFFLSTLSEAENAFFLGYSKSRLLMVGLLFVFLLLQAVYLYRIQTKQEKTQNQIKQLNHWLQDGDHLYSTTYGLILLFFFSLGSILFTWLFFPAILRPLLILFSILIVSLLIILRFDFKNTYQTKSKPTYIHFLPRLNHLSSSQKKTFFILMGLGLIYFLLFIPVNLLNTSTAHIFKYNSGDEGVIYPILMEMFVPEENFSSQLYRFFIYEDYHYGYPFYALSALILLPIWLIAGETFPQQIQLNMMLLRQIISVLPNILSMGILVYLVTRFKHRWYSVGLFLFLLFIPGVVKYNIMFWHPDSLGLLCIILTLYFLQRDQFSFGPNWITAAITCGLASATRMLGFFSVLVVAYILLYALFAKKIPLKKLILAGLIFILVMSAVIVLASPYLFHPAARTRYFQILNEKQFDMKYGYNHPDPENIYRTGWQVWLPFLEQHYGQKFFLLYTMIGLLITSFISKNRQTYRLIGLWVLPSLGYLIYFVVVKSYQYLLPPLVPFLATSFTMPIWLNQQRRTHQKLFIGLEVLLILVLLIQSAAWINFDWMLYFSEF